MNTHKLTTTQARKEELYLKSFKQDWATGEIIQQFINGRRRVMSVKERGVKRKRTNMATSSRKRARHESEACSDNSDQLDIEPWMNHADEGFRAYQCGDLNGKQYEGDEEEGDNSN
jgi:hypothetical protein